jgi:2-polyprenyl-3-methyl-5-hydroxy-6-metoxy-1,4-benzoquinol methylase/tetratricopeptide (TPR) repeat protein
MNRKERRAAIARNEAASSAAAADIAQLMQAANSAYRGLQIARAEVICKQILSRAPTHATCLNLLGLIYQASGRHRLAVKLLAKALAVDDLDAGFHYNIACSYHAMGDQIAAAEHFKTAIALGMGNKKDIEEFLMENVVLIRCVDRIASGYWSFENDLLLNMDDIAAIAQDILLRCALELTPIRGVPLELLLTSLRSAFLRLVADDPSGADQVDDDVVHLFCALAQQCFINEYVFALTDKEKNHASELRELLVRKLSTGRSISPLLLAAVAAYFPLYSIPTAESLLTLEWPECAAHLLRQQVSEPLEEAVDSLNIPALTEIDDPTSIAVMQQYDENPYPRWTLNPLKVIAGDMKRHAQAIGSQPRRGQDILIAGCGTHAFLDAQYSPDARILAIDISRTSLAYARRKTREEGLQNIEYAQADILKLGAIGRTFDRIEAIGVLHHLADPKAGWRVLVSLLAPNGIMRIGLYSETARRAIVQARALITERGCLPTVEGIRALRQTIIRNQQWNMLLEATDFYCTSGCRDLLFNVMEHRFTIPGIAAMLKEYELSFLGFELNPTVIEKFQQRYPGADALTDLEHWNAFELANPNTFRGMYVFTASKSEKLFNRF